MKTHPNRAEFQGVLAVVDSPSSKAPSGARGRCVILDRVAAKAALKSLVGMGVCVSENLDGHKADSKIGVISHAKLTGNKIMVEGYLFALDCRAAIQNFTGKELGMSYEVSDARVEDVRAEVWTLTDITFTGAAILLREKAAYSESSFELRKGN